MNNEIKKENIKNKTKVSFEDGLGFVFGMGLAWILGSRGIISFGIIMALGVLISRKMLKSNKTYIRAIFILIFLPLSVLGGIIMKEEVYPDLRQKLEQINSIENFQELEIDKKPENSEIIGNLYRNKKYHFRIKFPEGWAIKNGDGQHIVQKAISNNNSTVSIVVFNFDIGSEKGFESIRDVGEVKEFIDTSIEEIRPKFNDIQILDYGETQIDNLPTYWVEYSFSYTALDTTVKSVNLAYYLAKDDTLYSIVAGSESDVYYKEKSIILDSIKTFVLE